MAERVILERPDPRLYETCAAVEAFDDSVRTLAQDLVDTLYATAGMALSAPQLGDLRQVLVMDHSGNQSAPEVYVNPVILARSAPGLVQESCLSLPGVEGTVLRHTRVRVRAQDERGASFERDLEGMPAVSLQHEMDHLEGTLFVDRLVWFSRLRRRLLGAA